MNLSILVVSQCPEVVSLIGEKGDSLLDKDLLHKAKTSGLRVSSRALRARGRSAVEILRQVYIIQKDFDGGIIVIDDELNDIRKEIFPAMLSIPLAHSAFPGNPQNTLRKALSLALRILSAIKRFCDEGSSRILCLPLENFSAKEIQTFKERLSGGVQDMSFIPEIESFLKSMRTRQSPKTSSRFQTVYLVDDMRHFFGVAREKHAKPETKIPPHEFSCVLHAKFRMCYRVPDERHYNVSREDDFIKGVFVDCHGTPVLVKPTTHLNMFPNNSF